MAVPFRKISKTRGRMRRTHYKIEANGTVKCSNCGAAITGNKCDYCRTTIKTVDFKISSIKKIIDD